MKFELVPILSIMEELYSQPISGDRFQAYLDKLQGASKGDLSLPIGGFNPMPKTHILQKIQALKNLQAESLMNQTLETLNAKIESSSSKTIQVVLNLADDLHGAWTNFYTTDFDSKFKLNALVSRNFCTPYFWTSEVYNEAMLINRTLAYAYRTIYWLKHQKLKTLKDYLAQEVFVHQQMDSPSLDMAEEDFLSLEQFYKEHNQEEDYSILFNFFYGDEASSSLHYPTYGIKVINGFQYAQQLAFKTKQGE